MLNMILNFNCEKETVTFLSENERMEINLKNTMLLASVREARAECAAAYGIEVTEPVEMPSATFLDKRAVAESRTGGLFRKFFTN